MREAPQVGNQYRTPAAGYVRTDGERITVTINTDDLDRHKTIIEPGGAELDHYRRNPIVLAGHSLTKVLGTSNVRLEGGKLVAEMTRWSESDVAQKWRADIEAGIVRAASIGFRVLKYVEEKSKELGTYYRITRWQLVEWSWVAVPSNPHATVARSIQPLTLRGDGSKRFPKKAAIHFTDEQFERLISGRVHADVTPGANSEAAREGDSEPAPRRSSRTGIVRGAEAVFGPGQLRGSRVAGALANPPRKAGAPKPGGARAGRAGSPHHPSNPLPTARRQTPEPTRWAAPAEEDAGATVRGMW